MPIRITGKQTTVPGEILGAVIGDPSNTSTVTVSNQFSNFLTNLSFTADRQNLIISSSFWVEKSSSGSDCEIVVRLTESGNVVDDTAKRFHVFGPEAGGLVITCQWVVDATDGNSYTYRPQILKSSNQSITVKAGGEYPMYLFQAIGL